MRYCAIRAPSRPSFSGSLISGPHGDRGGLLPVTVDVLLHISTVEPLSPTSCEYIGV